MGYSMSVQTCNRKGNNESRRNTAFYFCLKMKLSHLAMAHCREKVKVGLLSLLLGIRCANGGLVVVAPFCFHRNELNCCPRISGVWVRNPGKDPLEYNPS